MGPCSSDLKTCEFCFYWERKSNITDQDWGVCGRTLSSLEGAADKDTLAYAFSSGTDDAFLTTEKNFGCTQFKKVQLRVLA